MARFTQNAGGTGSALNFVQVAGEQVIISSAPNSFIDLDITTTGKPVQISVTGEGSNASSGSWVRINLFRDNIAIGNEMQLEASATSENVPYAINFIDDVAAGTYNYSARVTTMSGGNWTFGEVDGPIMNAVELTGFKGDTGATGLAGTDGADGADGDSAYDIAVANGFPGTEQEWLDSFGGGSSADIADFVFTDDSNNTGRSIISLPGDKGMTIAAGEDSDLYITAGDDLYIQTLGTGDDIHLNAADDVRFTTNNENSETETIYEWIMNSEGQFLLPGDGYISNPVSSSGDGYGNETLHLVPDSNLSSDQSIIIDPTTPNHIHIRAGGTQDASTAELILGGERTNVRVVDGSGTVSVTSKVLDVTNFYPNVNTEVNSTFMTYLANTPDIVQGDYVQVDDVEYYIHTVTTDSEFIYATVSGATFVQDQYYLFRRAMTGTHQWSFTDDGDLVLPDGSPSIINPATPGDITLSAYNGVRLAFAQSQEGSGLIFPDNTVQTTAYTGGSAGTGDITFVNNTISSDTGDDIIIQNKDASNIVKARIVLDQSNEQVLIEAMNQDSNYYNSGSWSSATWTGNLITINGTPDIINFFNTVPGNITGVSVNNGSTVQYDGASYGPENIGINVIGTPPTEEDPLTVTEIVFYYAITSKIDINYDNGSFDIVSKQMSMTIDSSGDLELNARDEDIDIRANDDIRFTTNWVNGGTEPQWRMTNTGRFEFPGMGYIENPSNSSGDGNGNDTLVLVPDDDLVSGNGSDQYLIIDPTSPNHIHIRSGGAIDESSAYLIVGGEKTNVIVSDGDRNVYVNSRSPFIINSYTNLSTENSTTFTVASTADIQNNYTVNVGGTDYIVDSVNSVDEGVIGVTANGAVFDANGSYTFTYEQSYSNQWIFHNSGTLSGPTEPGWLQVSGIYGEAGSNTYIASQENLVLYTDENQGVYINDANDGLNEVATKRDIANVGEEFTVIEESFTVNGGSLGTQPTFDGAPLFSGTYVKTGPMVHFQIQVDMDNILTFGTGQYYVDLPFDAKYGYQFKEGCLHDISTSNQFAIGGHVAAATNRLYLTYTGSNGQDEMFTHSSPVGLNIADNFHIAGTYIAS